MYNDHVVIITGASKGLGAAVARWLGQAGTRVVLVARSNDTLQECRRAIETSGGTALAFSMDVADAEACRAVVDNTLHRFGRIDGIVNNAGIVIPLAFIENADITSWQYCMEVNMLGPFYMTKFSLPALKKHRGRVINVSSGAANIPIKTASAYCASKAALTHFTAVLAAEEPRITAVAVRPGVVDTDMQAIMRGDGPYGVLPETSAYYKDLQAQGMLEPPEIPARSIAWLVLNVPHEMTGTFRNYDDPDIKGPALHMFGPHRF